MSDFFQNLPDGWTIYVWLIVAAFILIAAAFMLRWAAKNDQFDEDIKYVIFDKNDRDKMDPDEFKKHEDVMKHQENLRDEYLKRQAAKRK